MNTVDFTSSQQLIKYTADFETLLALDRDTDIFDIVKGEVGSKRMEEAPGKGIFGSYFPSKREESETAYKSRVAKCFRKKIKGWNETLDEDLEEARRHQESLKILKEVVGRIFDRKVTAILRERLIEKMIYPEKTAKALTRLDNLIYRTFSTPFPVSHTLNFPVFSNRAALRNTCFISDQTSQFYEDCTKYLERKSANEVSIFEPQWGAGWQDRLIDGIKKLKQVGEICSLSKEIESLQAITLINYLVSDQNEEWKLIYLLGALKYTTFAETLHCFTPNLLAQTNYALNRSSKESLAWFETAFQDHSDGFIKSCNVARDKIDALATRFRRDTKGYLLTHADIAPIFELKDNIELSLKGIHDYLKPLIEGVITHPETKHVLFDGLDKEYHVLLKRLTETKNPETRPAGCLFPIIYRNAFENYSMDNEDDAIEIFAAWSITGLEDYKDVGLLGNISENDFDRLKNEKNIFTVATENLNKLDIKTIADWKRIHVFNRSMLKAYLLKNQDKLSEWSSKEL